MPKEAVVLGAGVVGLTAARALATRGWDVRVVAERAPADTVSAVAGASFKPHALGTSPLSSHMLRASKDALDRLWEDDRGHDLRVTRGRHREVRVDADADMSHLSLMTDVQWARRGRWPVDVTYSTYLFDPVLSLEALVSCVQGLGGEVATGVRVSSLEQLVSAHPTADLVVNCAGLGAGVLAGDGSLVPVKGQAVSVPRTQVDTQLESYSIGGFYLYQRNNDLLLGGTTEWGAPPGNDAGAVERILAGHALLHPELSNLVDVHPLWGMRPYRPSGLCLGPGGMASGTPVLHNYGHGGSGWTLALGCAERIAALAEALPGSSS